MTYCVHLVLTWCQDSACSSKLSFIQISESSCLSAGSWLSALTVCVFCSVPACCSRCWPWLCGSAVRFCFGLCCFVLSRLSLTILQRKIILYIVTCISPFAFGQQMLHPCVPSPVCYFLCGPLWDSMLWEQQAGILIRDQSIHLLREKTPQRVRVYLSCILKHSSQEQIRNSPL